MKRLKYVIPVTFILLCAGVHQVYQRGCFTFFNQQYITRVTAEQGHRIINENAPVILDVRSKEEFNISHLEGAFRAFRSDMLNKETAIILYCTAGFRSNKVAVNLRETGFKRIYELKGGLIGWANAGLPMVNNRNKLTETVHVYCPLFRYFLKNGKAIY